MTKALGWTLAAVALVAAVVVIALAAANLRHGREQVAQAPSAVPAKPPRQGTLHLDGLSLKEFDSQGRLRWRVASSGSITVDRDRMTAQGKDISWELVRADDARLRVQAPELLVDYRTRTVALSKGVQAESTTEGFSFTAGSMVYNGATDRVRATDVRRAELGPYRLRAVALGFDRLGKTVTAVGDVELRRGDYVVRSQQVAVDLAAARATLTGEPRLQRGEYWARADRVNLDARAAQAWLQGDVRLQRGELSARARNALFTKAPQRAELAGGVTLRGPGFRATSRKLVMDGASKTATLTGGVHVSGTIVR